MFKRNRTKILPGSMMGKPLRKLPREGAIVASLDVGAAKTVCFIARMTPYADGHVDCDIIGAGHIGATAKEETDTSQHRVRLDHRSPQSFARQEQAIRAAVDAAESMAGERITDVHVSVPAHSVYCARVGVDIDIAGGFVTADDICDSLAEGARLTIPENSQPLHTIPIAYAIDGEMVGTDPRGLRGHTLTSYMLGVNASANMLASLIAAVESAGLNVASFVAAPLATAQSILVADEMELGVLAIDIGAHAVGYALYQEGRMTGCGGCLPGAGYVTRDIAEAFSTPLQYAERQKILHGTVLSSAGDEHRFVDMVGFGDATERTRISRADMTSVILPRMEEIYEALTRKMIDDHCDLASLRRLVLTGGGSQMRGLCDHAEKAFSMKARLGKPIGLDGLPEALTGPSFAAGIGVLHHLCGLLGVGHQYPEIDAAADRTFAARAASGGGGGWRKLKF